MGDGSATLRFLDPASFEVVRRLRAHGDVLLVLKWLAAQPGATLGSSDDFIRIACNATGLLQPVTSGKGGR